MLKNKAKLLRRVGMEENPKTDHSGEEIGKKVRRKPAKSDIKTCRGGRQPALAHPAAGSSEARARPGTSGQLGGAKHEKRLRSLQVFNKFVNFASLLFGNDDNV